MPAWMRSMLRVERELARSAAGAAAGLAAAVAAFEFLLMQILPLVVPPGSPRWLSGLLDAGLLGLALGLVAYPALVRPLRRRIRRQRSQLDASGRRERALLETAEASMIVSIADAKGRITDVNDAFCRVSGYSREELLGRDHAVVNSGHHPRSMWTEMYRTVASGRVWYGAVRNRARDGSSYWVQSAVNGLFDARGRLDGYVSFRFDITAIKQAEERGRAFIAAMEAASDGLCLLDADGRVSFCNEAFARAAGASRGRIVGRPVWEALSGEAPELRRAVAEGRGLRRRIGRGHPPRRLARADSRVAGVQPGTGADSERVWLDLTLSAVPDEAGGAAGFVCALRDVSGDVERERELRLQAETARVRIDCAAHLASDEPLESRIESVLGVLAGLEGLEEQRSAALYLLDRGALRLAVTVGRLGAELLGSEEAVAAGDSPLGRAAAACLAGRAETLVSDRCTCGLPEPDAAASAVPHGHYVVPLRFEGRCEGVLCLFTGVRPDRTAARLHLLESVGERIGAAIAHERLRRRAAAAELERCGQMYAMGKEISTPMTSIFGAADLLAAGDLAADERAELIDMLRRNAAHLVSLVDNVLHIAGVTSDGVVGAWGEGSLLRSRRVLLVEPKERAAETLAAGLRAAGARVEVSHDARLAMSLAMTARHAGRPHTLIVVDEGLAVTEVDVLPRLLREAGHGAPIVVVGEGGVETERERFMRAGCSLVLDRAMEPDLLLMALADAIAAEHARRAA